MLKTQPVLGKALSSGLFPEDQVAFALRHQAGPVAPGWGRDVQGPWWVWSWVGSAFPMGPRWVERTPSPGETPGGQESGVGSRLTRGLLASFSENHQQSFFTQGFGGDLLPSDHLLLLLRGPTHLECNCT